MMTQIIIANIYAIFGLVSILAYGPQIKTLWLGATAPTEISIKTWTIWGIEGVVALSYGIFCLQDILFCVLTAMDLILVIAIIMLVLHNRYVRHGSHLSLSSAAIQYYFCRPFFAVAPVKISSVSTLKKESV